jgi:hypothetical protein
MSVRRDVQGCVCPISDLSRREKRSAQALELLYTLKTRPMRAQEDTRNCYTEPAIIQVSQERGAENVKKLSLLVAVRLQEIIG